MKIQFGRRFWIAATAAIVVFTVFMVGRNALHAVKIKRQINLLTREQAYYTEKIGQDSALLERLKRRLSGGVRPRELPHAAAQRTRIYHEGVEKAAPRGCLCRQ